MTIWSFYFVGVMLCIMAPESMEFASKDSDLGDIGSASSTYALVSSGAEVSSLSASAMSWLTYSC